MFDIDPKTALMQPKRRGRQKTLLREVGPIPNSEKKIEMYDGRYGPYVTDGEVNASLPKDADPEAFTVEQALALLEAAATKKSPRKKKAASKKKRRPRRRAEEEAYAKKKAASGLGGAEAARGGGFCGYSLGRLLGWSLTVGGSPPDALFTPGGCWGGLWGVAVFPPDAVPWWISPDAVPGYSSSGCLGWSFGGLRRSARCSPLFGYSPAVVGVVFRGGKDPPDAVPFRVQPGVVWGSLWGGGWYPPDAVPCGYPPDAVPFFGYSLGGCWGGLFGVWEIRPMQSPFSGTASAVVGVVFLGFGWYIRPMQSPSLGGLAHAVPFFGYSLGRLLGWSFWGGGWYIRPMQSPLLVEGAAGAFEDLVEGLLGFDVAGAHEEPAEEVVEVVHGDDALHLGDAVEEEFAFVGVDQLVEFEACEGVPGFPGELVGLDAGEVTDGAGRAAGSVCSADISAPTRRMAASISRLCNPAREPLAAVFGGGHRDALPAAGG